jgi:hypothetical protein
MRRALPTAPELITGPPEAAELPTQTENQAAEALADLRELARRIYPPRLADLGLPAVLEAQARKAALPVTIEAEGIGQVSRSRSRRPSTSASWKRCRTLRNTPPQLERQPAIPSQPPRLTQPSRHHAYAGPTIENPISKERITSRATGSPGRRLAPQCAGTCVDCPKRERRERTWPQSRAKKRGPASGRR